MVDPLVDFVNDMFFFVIKSTQASSYTMLFITFGFISVYCTLILSIVKKTFSMIHVIPDAVLNWISGGVHNLGISEASDKAEHLAGQSAARVGEATQSFGKAAGDRWSKNARSRATSLQNAKNAAV